MMSNAELKDTLQKQIVQLNMLINAAKQRGDIQAVINHENELIAATNAFNAIT